MNNMNMKPIKDFENLYYVCDNGNVWSVKRHKYLKQDTNSCGYKRVVLYKDGKLYHKLVHRLVAEAFIPNPNNLPQVNHKDEDKSNNQVNNIEWVSAFDNVHYGTALQRRVCKQFNNKYRSKAVIQYDKNFIMIKEYPSIMEAQRQTGYANTNISVACKHKHKTVGGFYWRYKNE